ncbi:MAG: hypothetical protein QME57_00250 [Patescibacteria group bacterium]|nr:hypothetical protein [Patescibacteria group bacterium]
MSKKPLKKTQKGKRRWSLAYHLEHRRVEGKQRKKPGIEKRFK